MDFTHPAFRFHAERVIRRILERYAAHPAVIGVQVDNEPGLELLFNRGVFHRFFETLRSRYGDVDRLNTQWGLTYWSHRLSAWDDLWPADGNTSPQYDLAWPRFQADLVTEFIGWQARVVREYTSPEQLGDSRGTGAVPRRGQNVRTRAEPFLVTETNATSIGGSQMNYPPYQGQIRQAAWALASRGAVMVEYWGGMFASSPTPSHELPHVASLPSACSSPRSRGDGGPSIAARVHRLGRTGICRVP